MTDSTLDETALLEESAAPARFPRAEAIGVARELLGVIAPQTLRIIVAGSLRRKRAMVGDVEIVFVPLTRPGVRTDLLQPAEEVSRVDDVLGEMIARGVLAKRLSVRGTPAWGPKNKLAVHVASGIPVDLFATTEANWWNYVVCRTGGSRSNIAICNAARARGWKWRPYRDGFTRGDQVHTVRSEAEVFEFVGLPYLAPEDRQ